MYQILESCINFIIQVYLPSVKSCIGQIVLEAKSISLLNNLDNLIHLKGCHFFSLDYCNLERYSVTMIKGFLDIWLQDFFEHDVQHKKIPAFIRERLFRKLQILDDATCDLDLRSPPSNHFEKLSGSLKGKVCIRVNRQWRLIFRWDHTRGEADDIYLDNHD